MTDPVRAAREVDTPETAFRQPCGDPCLARAVRGALSRGLAFLRAHQEPSGEFVTLWGAEEHLAAGAPVTTVFITATIANSLAACGPISMVREMAERATRWLLQQRDLTGYWIFFGATSRCLPDRYRLPPDVDDTACTLLALLRWGAPLPYQQIVASLLQARDRCGRFLTWIPDPKVDNPGIDPADVDPVVNANAYALCRAVGIAVPHVSDYLRAQLDSRASEWSSLYYKSPMTFFHALGRSVASDRTLVTYAAAQELRRAMRSLADSQGAPQALELSLAISAAARGLVPDFLTELTGVPAILSSQASDGGWPAQGFCYGYGRAFGSRELTTALAVEALALVLVKLRPSLS